MHFLWNNFLIFWNKTLQESYSKISRSNNYGKTGSLFIQKKITKNYATKGKKIGDKRKKYKNLQTFQDINDTKIISGPFSNKSFVKNIIGPLGIGRTHKGDGTRNGQLLFYHSKN